MKQIQFIQVTPEQLQEAIISGVKDQLEDLRKSFSTKEPTNYLTRNEVAELLHVDLSTVHNYTKRGKLIAYSFPGSSRVYYKRDEIENAMIQLNNK